MKNIFLAFWLLFLAWCSLFPTEEVDIVSEVADAVNENSFEDGDFDAIQESDLPDDYIFTEQNMSDEESILYEAITNKYYDIELNLDTYTKVEKEIFDDASEWWKVQAFYDGWDLVKLTATFPWEIWQKTYEYYMDHWTVYFMYERNKSYNAPVSDATYDDTLTTIDQLAHYFADWKLFYSFSENNDTIIFDAAQLKHLESITLDRLDQLLLEVQ